MQEGIGYFFVLVGYDHDGVGFVESLYDDVYHFGDDEVCHERVHGFVESEQEACAREYEQVDEHDDFTDGEDGFAVEDDGDDLGAVKRSAEAYDEPDAESVYDAAEYGCEEWILCEARQPCQLTGYDGEADDGEYGC